MIFSNRNSEDRTGANKSRWSNLKLLSTVQFSQNNSIASICNGHFLIIFRWFVFIYYKQTCGAVVWTSVYGNNTIHRAVPFCCLNCSAISVIDQTPNASRLQFNRTCVYSFVSNYTRNIHAFSIWNIPFIFWL